MAGQAFAFDPAQWLSSLDEDGFHTMRTLGDARGVAAGFVIHETAQWFGGQRVPSQAITALVVAAHLRRQQLGHELLLHQLREAREAKVPLSVLFASSPTFYRQHGYEPAGTSTWFRVPSHALPTAPDGAEFVPFTPDDHAPAHELYRRFASERAGLLDRNVHFWRMHLRPYDNSRRHSYRIDFAGVPEGYVCFQHAQPNRTLVVDDVVTTSTRAARAALALMSHHKAVCDFVLFAEGPQGPLRKLIPGNEARLEPPGKEWLLRLTDVARSLELRGYPLLDARLELDVADATLPDNAGRYVLELREGKPVVSRGGSGKIRVDVRGLAAIYSSFSHPSEVLAAGLLDAEPADVARLGAVFAGPAPFVLDTF
ncbi:MAG: family N-acetyltransferase [Polyangiaceae bacterium]|jgi:predicted acetyltransferase|nr:family N-acetyltransferase [Polyangiaceae bacterium]